MDAIKVKAVLSNLKKGGRACYQLHVRDPKPMSQEEFIALFAKQLGKPKAEARYISDVHGQCFCAAIMQNKVVNTGSLRGRLQARGSIPTANAPLDPERNPIVASIVAAGELKACVADVVALNDTSTVEAVLYTVQYEDAPGLNTIEGTGLVRINGRGLRLDPENADEGVWLEGEDGILATDRAVVAQNDENVIDCSFAELPPAGTYRLVILTRNGAPKDEYTVTRLDRLVKVVNG